MSSTATPYIVTTRGLAMTAVAALLYATPALAQKIVDPSKVAPEYREAAEKRQAEQLKLIACHKAAKEAKILPRDFAKYVAECLDK
jgi:hypothetical protein